MAKRIERVLTTDPGMGIARHADAGYEDAKKFAQESGVKLPMADYYAFPVSSTANFDPGAVLREG